MITKDQELAILTEAMLKLGPDSYLGPWLHQVRAELEAMMRADSFPCISLTEAAEDVAKILAKAEKTADEIKVAAKQRAEDRERLVDDQRERARALIIGAQQSLLAIEERL